ncbi:MAG: hypothetical protein V4543_08410 [Bacteroidota bacterium]
MQLAHRLASPRPRFFKKLGKYAFRIAAACGVITAAAATGLVVPAAVLSIISYVGTAASAVSVFTHFTVQNEPKEDGKP